MHAGLACVQQGVLGTTVSCAPGVHAFLSSARDFQSSVLLEKLLSAVFMRAVSKGDLELRVLMRRPVCVHQSVSASFKTLAFTRCVYSKWCFFSVFSTTQQMSYYLRSHLSPLSTRGAPREKGARFPLTESPHIRCLVGIFLYRDAFVSIAFHSRLGRVLPPTKKFQGSSFSAHVYLLIFSTPGVRVPSTHIRHGPLAPWTYRTRQLPSSRT